MKTDRCAWCSELVRSPNVHAITLEQQKQCSSCCSDPRCLGCIGDHKTYSSCMAPVGIHSGHHLKESCAVVTFSLEPFSRYSLLMSPLPACQYILGRDAESLPGPRRAEHHIGARTVISICMLSPPTAHTSVSAPHDHILTSLLLAVRYLLAQAPIRS